MKWKLQSASGTMVSSGPGMAGGPIDGGLGAVLMHSLIGAFFGLILGLILSHLSRFLSMSFNRNFGGYSWVIFGAVVGAAAFALLAIQADKN